LIPNAKLFAPRLDSAPCAADTALIVPVLAVDHPARMPALFTAEATL
jgi:hypothetical protein